MCLQVNFPEVLDLKKAGLLLAPESPLDRNMQVMAENCTQLCRSSTAC